MTRSQRWPLRLLAALVCAQLVFGVVAVVTNQWLSAIGALFIAVPTGILVVVARKRQNL